jgi:hypothetical protein
MLYMIGSHSIAMSEPSSLAAEFVATYYPVFVYEPSVLHKFYSSSAVIHRRAHDPVLAVPISELPASLLAQSLPATAKLAIGAYSVACLPDDDRFLISVSGFLDLSPSRRCSFSQTFILEEVDGRAFIVSDTLQICDLADTFAANIAIPRRSDQGSDDDPDDGRLRKKVKRTPW